MNSSRIFRRDQHDAIMRGCYMLYNNNKCSYLTCPLLHETAVLRQPAACRSCAGAASGNASPETWLSRPETPVPQSPRQAMHGDQNKRNVLTTVRDKNLPIGQPVRYENNFEPCHSCCPPSSSRVCPVRPFTYLGSHGCGPWRSGFIQRCLVAEQDHQAHRVWSRALSSSTHTMASATHRLHLQFSSRPCAYEPAQSQCARHARPVE